MFHLKGAQVVDVCLVEEKVSWQGFPIFDASNSEYVFLTTWTVTQIIFRWVVAIIEDLEKV